MRTPQTERLTRYLDDFGSITPAEAMKELGIMRLADVVFKLKGQGRAIDTELIEVKNRWGEPRRVARYRWTNERPALALEMQ